jgi:glucose/arabinose dehydrogenase
VPDPDFAATPWVYFSFAEPGTGSETGTVGTAGGRGRLVGASLQDVAVIFRQVPKVANSGVHFGSRMAFRSETTLSVTLGERIRDVQQGPDGDLYLLTDSGKLIQVRD